MKISRHILPALISLALPIVSLALPSGFIAEIVTDQNAITGVFAPNPRNDGKPMLLLVNRRGKVTILEDPDNSGDSIVILDLAGKLCNNGERGAQTIVVHPNFSENRYVYLYYNKFKEGCPQSSTEGSWNIISRFTMDQDTLLLDYNTREEIWRYVYESAACSRPFSFHVVSSQVIFIPEERHFPVPFTMEAP